MQDFKVRIMVFDGYPCKYDIKSQFVTIVTRLLSFLYTDNSFCELSVNRKLGILVAMVTEPWHNILFARIIIIIMTTLFKEVTHLGVPIFHVGLLIRKHNLQYSQHETRIYNIYNKKQNLHCNNETQ